MFHNPGRCDLTATYWIRMKADTVYPITGVFNWCFMLLHLLYLLQETFYMLPSDLFHCWFSWCPEMELFTHFWGGQHCAFILNIGDISRRSGSKRRCGAACLTRHLWWVGRVNSWAGSSQVKGHMRMPGGRFLQPDEVSAQSYSAFMLTLSTSCFSFER